MDVFVLKYDVDGNDGCASEILGIFSTFEKASKAFNFYLDEIEKSWREQDGSVSKENTFNRFSEIVDNILLNATCIRAEEPHEVSILRFSLD
jgi:hypothetical protein